MSNQAFDRTDVPSAPLVWVALAQNGLAGVAAVAGEMDEQTFRIRYSVPEDPVALVPGPVQLGRPLTPAQLLSALMAHLPDGRTGGVDKDANQIHAAWRQVEIHRPGEHLAALSARSGGDAALTRVVRKLDQVLRAHHAETHTLLRTLKAAEQRAHDEERQRVQVETQSWRFQTELAAQDLAADELLRAPTRAERTGGAALKRSLEALRASLSTAAPETP